MARHSITSSGDVGPLPPDDSGRPLTVAAPDDAGLKRLLIAGGVYTVLVSGEQTDGCYCLIDMRIPDGGGPPPHRHDFEEMFTLLEGELEFTFRGETRTVRAPATVNVPANAPHRFENRSGRTVHMLCMCAPAGQDEFFAAIGIAVDDPSSPPDPSPEEKAAKGALAGRLAPKYRTEMLQKA